MVGFFAALQSEGLLVGATAEQAAVTRSGLVHGLATLVLENQLHGQHAVDAALTAARLLEGGMLRAAGQRGGRRI